MKEFDINQTLNPVYNTVNGLSNKTFDPDNIVSGRGATEDQLKVVGDIVTDIQAYVDEYGCQNDPYQYLRDLLDQLQTQQEECCQNRVTQENLDALLQQLRDKLDDLEARIEECCQSCFDGGGGDTSSCDGSTVTVTMSWDSNPVANGGQMSAVSSGGAAIVFYYFLIKTTAGVYTPVGTVGFAGQGYSVNGSTGKLSFDPGGLHGSVSGIAIGARDANGCEGIGVFVPVTGVNIGG